MTLELFIYTLAGIQGLEELNRSSYDDFTYYVGGEKSSAKEFLDSIYNISRFKEDWVLERIKKDVFLINSKLNKVIIPVSFTDHPHFKARSYGKGRYLSLVAEMKEAIQRASSLASRIKFENKGVDISVLCLDKSLGHIYDAEMDDPLDAYYPLDDINMLDYIRRFGFEYFILYSPLKHIPTPDYDEIGEYYVAPRLSIMDKDYKGSTKARSYQLVEFKEQNLVKDGLW